MKIGKRSESLVEYTHGPMEESVAAIGGSYRITEEKRMAHHGQEVLYLMGAAHMDNACCGAWGCCYAIVKGFVRDWRYKKDRQGCALSRIAPVTDLNEQERIRSRIMAEEMVQQVIFT